MSAGLDLEWTIFEGFRIRTDYRRLQELKAQGELETRIAIEDFVASLAAEYYNFVQQKIRLKNFRYAVSLSKERLRIVEARYRIGSFSRLDLLQAPGRLQCRQLAVHHAAGARIRFAYPAQRADGRR